VILWKKIHDMMGEIYLGFLQRWNLRFIDFNIRLSSHYLDLVEAKLIQFYDLAKTVLAECNAR